MSLKATHVIFAYPSCLKEASHYLSLYFQITLGIPINANNPLMVTRVLRTT